ncbi:MAG: hypothetical protein O3C40_13145 [Planctomycetota bacterium]|nr:hypothetical protein [Planctomycetota bacterium]
MHESVEQWNHARGSRRLAPKWVAVIAGLCFAIPGFLGVVANVPLFDKLATRTWMETRDGPGYYADSGYRVVQLSDTQHGIIHNGFEPGETALFCMFFFTVGAGVSAGRFLDVTGRQNLWLLLGTTWHVLGIGTLVAYVHLAPRPFYTMPLVGIGVYEWAGLFLIALGMRKHWFAGRLHEATWNLWVGSALGGVAGAIVGALIDFVRFGILKESALGGFAVLGWIYGGLLGGVVIGMAFVVYHCWKPNPQT